MKTTEIRKLFLDYYVQNGHKSVESSSLLPHNDDTLLFTNAGMVQFKNIFTGLETRDYLRATTSQKCLRAGGKHNDLDNVGYTARHHTFFEMLGNFSFGDYFKEEAISYAWDFLTNHLGLNKDKLLVTIYHSDDEAFNLWKKIAGFGDDKIIRIKSSDNFWEMGDVGPCGPCTEIFYDHGEDVFGGPPGSKDEDGDRFIEIWNLVFMQYQKLSNKDMLDLKKPCIDTGMGLERIASILQNKKDNYDIDLFQNIINDASNIFKTKITPENKTSFKVIADHLRAVSFMVADGITPSNEGRGYVLRRILRRAVRYAYMLGAKEPVIYKLFDSLKREMVDSYKELALRDSFIIDTIKQEEVKFGETFENGIRILNQELDKNTHNGVFSGSIAFKLYDTYGFPVDLTQDILRGKNIKLDQKGFDEASEHHKNLAKSSWKGSKENKEDPLWFEVASKISPTEFVGHANSLEISDNISNNIGSDGLTTTAVIKFLISIEGNVLANVDKLVVGQEGYLIVDKTPFYAELGGQLADKGTAMFGDSKMKILDVQKRQGDIFYHKFIIESGEFTVGNEIIMEVDRVNRLDTSKNHTSAHVLYSALQKIIGKHITQQGSMVSNERLRLDVSHNKALSEEEIIILENAIQQTIMENHPVIVEDMPLEKAIELGAVPLFAEKYPDIARTVKIGRKGFILEDFELCGGTHVQSTGELGTFKIISEGSIASGIRRIEAVCGRNAHVYFQSVNSTLKNISKTLVADSNSVEDKVKGLLSDNNTIKKDYNNLFNRFHSEKLINDIEDYNDVNLLFKVTEGLEVSSLRDISNSLLQRDENLIVILFVVKDNKASFLLSLGKNVASKIDFTNLSKEFLQAIDGNGGGSKTSLQGVGKVDNITSAKNFVVSFIKQ